ncbi:MULTISPECIES: hypothetical protein [unclassified Sphingomonas]|uniref:hypothetical protein n=1 Tax=unclassified Sphingomonas TaxID=196159 RepID=UPI00226A3CC7|nr:MULTISPECIES: hypothetical protein [unclassified Sphingomonas]
MAELIQIIPMLGASGVAGWAGNAILQWSKARGERDQARASAEIDLEQHRDKLTFDLLSAARSELAAARAEVAELRPLQTRLAHIEARLAHFEEALGHLEALLGSRDAPERAQAERLAKAFVTRMRRLGDAHGTLLNEAQREQSAERMASQLDPSMPDYPRA